MKKILVILFALVFVISCNSQLSNETVEQKHTIEDINVEMDSINILIQEINVLLKEKLEQQEEIDETLKELIKESE